MTTTPKAAKAKRPTVDLTDMTLDELDAAAKLMDDGHGRVKSYAYVGRNQLGMPDLTLEAAGQLTMRQVSIIESDPDEDDDDPSPAP
jgi:hypothetical protein